MKKLIKLLAYLSAINGILLFIRPRDTSLNTLIWIPKMIGAALSQVLRISGLLGALVGLGSRDRGLSFAGFIGAGLNSRFIEEIPDGRNQFRSVFGSELKEPLPAHASGPVDFQPDLVIGQKPKSGKRFVADLWQPPAGRPRSGLGIIYSHGSGWRVGDKDMLTRPFFQRLAERGHVILDIAYTLYPEAGMQTMVSEVNQAILWMKENSQTFGINPDRIVLMGGSAGAHLSLLAAYTPGQAEFQPAQQSGDTTVRGVVAFYPAVDLREMYTQNESKNSKISSPIDNLADALFNRIFMLHPDSTSRAAGSAIGHENYLVDILGGTLEDIPEVYDLLSPITHVSKECPPTLLLQGSDDVFDLAIPVRRLHQALQEAGVGVVLVEYPHTEHGFDLMLPQISPVAQAAMREVERFLALIE